MAVSLPDDGRQLPALPSALDRIAADLRRVREVCTALDGIAAAEVTGPEVPARLAAFLAVALPRHLAEVEEDLQALLRRRCEPEDGIAAVFTRLAADRSRAEAGRPAVAAILARLAAGALPRLAERTVLAAHAAELRRHLVLVSALVLPMARLRLRAPDLAALAGGLQRRRGAALPGEAPHAG